jgi:ribosome-binding protein aMBF1 (putative translation factor)
MIKTETAYRKAVDKLQEDLEIIEKEKERFRSLGLTDEEVKIAIEPQITFHEQMKEEVEYYERIKRGDFGQCFNLNDLGKMLVAYRIYLGISQQELAARLDVAESQVSRDERHEYYGATKERLQEVMEAMDMTTVTQTIPRNNVSRHPTELAVGIA